VSDRLRRRRSAETMIGDLEIYRSASVLIGEHGEEAGLEVSSWAGALVKKGGRADHQVVVRIPSALKQLQNSSRERAEPFSSV
jgi:hypothetical protein